MVVIDILLAYRLISQVEAPDVLQMHPPETEANPDATYPSYVTMDTTMSTGTAQGYLSAAEALSASAVLHDKFIVGECCIYLHT